MPARRCAGAREMPFSCPLPPGPFVLTRPRRPTRAGRAQHASSPQHASARPAGMAVLPSHRDDGTEIAPPGPRPMRALKAHKPVNTDQRGPPLHDPPPTGFRPAGASGGALLVCGSEGRGRPAK